MSIVGNAAQPPDRSARDAWLIAPTTDFWLGCAGGGLLLLGLAVVLHWHGDRELKTADLLLGEVHLGATYDAVVRRGLWRRMPFEVIAVPVAMTAAIYALMFGDRAVLVTTIVLYLAAWHRGRQNLGIARWYQLRMGGPISSAHERLFRAAVYLPMVAGAVYFATTAPLYQGDEFVRLAMASGIVETLGGLALAIVGAYVVFALVHRERIHPGERWVVVANAMAFGAAYVVGAWRTPYILVLAIPHEVQYVYFTYALARRSAHVELATLPGEVRLLASFAVWPALDLTSWGLCQLSESDWIPPFLVAGLLWHYWLDGRIWTARARRLGRSSGPSWESVVAGIGKLAAR